MAKKRTKKTAVKKKTWVSIQAPESLGKQVLGESYVEDKNNVVGKTVKANCMTLLNDPKKKRYNMSFMVDAFENDIAKTKPFQYNISPASLKIMIRKKRDRIDHRFSATTADGNTVIVKPLILTRGNTTNEVGTAIRKGAEESLKASIAKLGLSELFSQVMQLKLQRELKKELAKLYPISTSEIRVLKVKQYAEA